MATKDNSTNNNTNIESVKVQQVDDNRSFAETLFQDAFNPGVHKKSLDTTNYVLIALLICALVAWVMWDYNIHFIVIVSIATGLGVMMNINRNAILEASAEFFKQKAAEEEKKRKEEEALFQSNEEEQEEDDDDVLYVDDDVELTDELIEKLWKEQREKKRLAKEAKQGNTTTSTTIEAVADKKND